MKKEKRIYSGMVNGRKVEIFVKPSVIRVGLTKMCKADRLDIEIRCEGADDTSWMVHHHNGAIDAVPDCRNHVHVVIPYGEPK